VEWWNWLHYRERPEGGVFTAAGTGTGVRGCGLSIHGSVGSGDQNPLNCRFRLCETRHVNLSVFFDSCLSSQHDQSSVGDRLLSDNRHGIRSIRERDNKLSCSSSEHR
jgi:hypothetical protein